MFIALEVKDNNLCIMAVLIIVLQPTMLSNSEADQLYDLLKAQKHPNYYTGAYAIQEAEG